MKNLLKKKFVRYNSTRIGSEEVHGRFNSLVKAFRTYGHFEAQMDPLDLSKPMLRKELNPSLYGFKVINNELFFDCDGIINLTGNKRYANLMEILKHLRDVYCGNVGSIFMHLDTKEQYWIARELEESVNIPLTKEQEVRYFKLIQESETFDQYLSKKFPTTKRYGLEGSESIMIALDKVFETLSKESIESLVIGMPHRGRLNMMTALLNYSARNMFRKIKGLSEFPSHLSGTGDVLSHLGTSTVLNYSRPLKVSLLNNPSHLEAINPVALGKTRAKIQNGENSACLLIHGDSSFAGQGIIMETLGLANLPYFTTNGSIHIIVNNQLGFTTTKEHSRSSRYSGDIGKMINAPLFVVNGEKIQDIVRVIDIATRYRNKFKKDVIVEIVAYRRHGHNELDEPMFTQPFMYKIIKSRSSIVDIYGKSLIEKNKITPQEIEENKAKIEQKYEEELKKTEEEPEDIYFKGKWKDMKFNHYEESPQTGYSLKDLENFGYLSVKVPSHFTVHPRLLKYHIETRIEAIKKNQPLDWATVEAMALASIINDGFHLRLCGQDVGRGTFSQRHLVIANQDTTELYNTLEKIPNGKFEIVPSSLSELAVLGFEYGYTIQSPKNLSIWEAQFGDFSLNAQTIIDQFIVCGEDKWMLQSGLVMLLPHGYDGNGPEHSSCRIERYLQLANSSINNKHNPNMYIVNCTTPANYFHALRRQIMTKYRKPLIVVSPKTLLRHPKCVSTLNEIGPETKFQPILTNNVSNPKQIILCSGKIYYDMIQTQDTLIIRLEELYPFPVNELETELSKHQTKKISWVQEEPENQGCYYHVKLQMIQLEKKFNFSMDYIGRDSSSSPATGISMVHKKENETIQKKISEFTK